jgi:hypothetical protein
VKTLKREKQGKIEYAGSENAAESRITDKIIVMYRQSEVNRINVSWQPFSFAIVSHRHYTKVERGG